MFNLSPICSARKSSNHKLSKKHKINPDTNLNKTKHTQTSNTKFFEELVPSVSPLSKKARKARTRWYRGPFRWFINTIFLSIKKKEWRETIKKKKLDFRTSGSSSDCDSHRASLQPVSPVHFPSCSLIFFFPSTSTSCIFPCKKLKQQAGVPKKYTQKKNNTQMIFF